jgi:polyphosphate kinase 2 (PPK2 family)
MSSDKAKNEKMKRKDYEKALRKLHVELVHLQEWVKAKGLRVIIIFEGRDAAGKGGTIKAIMERVSPRVFRVMALPAPSDRQKTQLFFQRYFEHFPPPASRDLRRSWYNRLVSSGDGICRCTGALPALPGVVPGDRDLHH